jgi:hypothetical protein
MSAYANSRGFGLNTSGKSNSKPVGFDATVMVPFVRVPLKLMQLMSRDSALLLSYLVNWETVVSSQFPINGHFYVTQDKLETELRMSPQRQRQLLRRLEARGFLRAQLFDHKWTISIKYRRILRDVADLAD